MIAPIWLIFVGIVHCRLVLRSGNVSQTATSRPSAAFEASA
jgi:hypothetical protein